MKRRYLATVGYLGPKGTFSYEAAMLRRIAPRLIPFDSLDAVIEAVESTQVEGGILPLKNSVVGRIEGLAESLARFPSVGIMNEVTLPTHISLITPKETRLVDIKEVWSRTEVFGQCQSWLEKNLPNAAVHECESTAKMCEDLKQKPDASVLGPACLVTIYDFCVLASNIEDEKTNSTTFAVIAKQQD